MNQPALFDHTEEASFFLPKEELRKRYTGNQVAALEAKQTAALLLVAWGCPAEIIARELQLSTRTVAAWTSQESAKVAGWRREYADSLLKSGAKAFALADTKAGDASYLQLVTGGGILTDKAIALAAMGEMGEEKIVKEGVSLAEAAAAIRARMERRRPAELLEPGGQALEADCLSGDGDRQASEIVQAVAAGEADPPPPPPARPTSPPSSSSSDPSDTTTPDPGGGVGPPAGPGGPTGADFVDLSTKGPV